MVRVSPTPPRMHLLVRDQAADPQAVHADAVDVGAAGAVEGGAGGVRHRAAAGLAAGGGDQLRRTPRGAGGRVGLVGVVQLDDLDRLVERRGRARRSASSASRRWRSSARSARRCPGRRPASRAASSSRASSKPVVPTTAWMPWLDAELEVVHHHVGVGEVDDRLGAGGDQVARGVAGVDRARPARGRRRPRPPGTPRRRPCRGRRARPPQVAARSRSRGAQPQLTRDQRLSAGRRGAAFWQSGAHGAADDSAPDPVGGRGHGRPAVRPRARDRLRAGGRAPS